MKWMREPLLHFLLLGAGLFVLHAWLRPSPAGNPALQIEVSPADIDQLTETFSRQWFRPPTPSELDKLVSDMVRERIFAREAAALGLDRDDVIIRRRLAQKFEFVSQDLVQPRAPSEAELAAYLEEHRARYERPATTSIEQLFFDPGRRTDAEQDARAMRTRLAAGMSEAAPSGDAFLVPGRLDDQSDGQLVSQLGKEFTAAVRDLPVGTWQGPVRSAYGWHLVRVLDRLPAVLPPLAEVRHAVEGDWINERRQEAEDELYARLRARYRVVITGAPDESRVAQIGGAKEALP